VVNNGHIGVLRQEQLARREQELLEMELVVLVEDLEN
jgi:hypothetical protein